jgi:hypothetical protein
LLALAATIAKFAKTILHGKFKHQIPNTNPAKAGPEQIPMTEIQNSKQSRFGHWFLELEIYLGFGFWNLGFRAYAIHC